MAIVQLSCSDSDNGGTEESPVDDGKSKFAIWLQLGSWPNTTQYVAGVDDITTGEISLEGNGDEVTSKADYGIVTNGDGYYYYPSSSTDFGKMTKFEYKDDQLQVVSEVPFTYQNSINAHTWIDETTLIFYGLNGDRDKLLYTILNTETLAMTNGEFDLPAIPQDYTGIYTGNIEYVNGKILMTYTYNKDWPEKGNLPIYLAEIEYPSMSTKSISEETRTLAMGGINMWESSSTVNEENDIYMMFNPGWYYDADNNSGVFRIKNGETTFDQSYFFNLTETLGGSTSGLWYIGNGKAIVKYEDAATIAANPDTLFNALYALVDLPSSTVIKKLELPLDKGTGLQSVTIDNGKAYIVVNAETEKDYVWEVDSNTGAVSAGLEIVGGYEYILRIDKLKE
ncbi:hypothetical protein GCM10022397_11150 [Flavivirga jejuensis]